MKKPLYWVGGGFVLFLAAIYVWTLPYNPDAATLARQALTAAKPEDRIRAVLELANNGDKDSAAQLDRVIRESQDPQVLIRVIPALILRRNDGDTREAVMDKLSSADKGVREAAFDSLPKLVNLTPEEKDSYKPDDAAEKREPAAALLREKYKKAPIPSSPAAVSVAAATPSTTPPAAAPSPSPAPVPAITAAPSPAPTVSYDLPPPKFDYAAINLLSWMFRILAVLVLVAEVAGILGLIVGEIRPKKARKDARTKSQPTAAEEIERPSAKESEGRWSKVTDLVRGALLVVALLMCAEMMQVVIAIQQSAFRVEQKMDSLSRK